MYLLIFVFVWQFLELHDLYELPIYSEEDWDINYKKIQYLKIEMILILILMLLFINI